MLKFIFTLIFFQNLFFSFAEGGKNNVCKNMYDYLTIDNNENCWHNPDVGRTPEQIITRYGFPFESYNVVTEDGYINTIYRIPYNNTHKNITRQPILLRPGFGGGPSTFLYLGNRSSPFFLVNNGFDVWLSNRRGTLNGKGHRVYNKEDKEFWDFSFHECGFYDIKSEINFIAKRTKSHQKIILLGYSVGTTESYIYAILRRKHAQRYVSGIISLGPMAFMRKSGVHMTKLARYVNATNFLRSKNPYALFLENDNEGNESKKNLTDIRFTFDQLVRSRYALSLFIGKDSSQIDPAELPVYLACKPTPSSVKTVVHFAQEVKAGGNFQQYDYGVMKNVEVYNSSAPPIYHVSKINVPVHLFYGEGDLISDKEDVLELYNKLKVANKSLTSISQEKNIEFSHADFTIGKNIQYLLYEVLLKTIRENLE